MPEKGWVNAGVKDAIFVEIREQALKLHKNPTQLINEVLSTWVLVQKGILPPDWFRPIAKGTFADLLK